MNVYKLAKKDKKVAAQIILPLMEFEFELLGSENPRLIQSFRNKQQFLEIFEICKTHKWTTTQQPLTKKSQNTLMFTLNEKGLREIFELAGPFADEKKNQWIKLLLQRKGKKGGFMKNKKSTEEKVLELLKKSKRWMGVIELCTTLKLLPSTIRKSLKKLVKEGVIKRKKLKVRGNVILYKYCGTSPRSLRGQTAE